MFTKHGHSSIPNFPRTLSAFSEHTLINWSDMVRYGQKGHLWPHIWQISQVRYPWNHRKCALCISVHHRNVEIHLGKYVYFTAHSVPTVELIMNRHGQVRSLCHPCRKDERSSKRSVKRLFEKILIGDTVTWWNCNPRLLPVFLLHHTKLLHPECTPSLRAYSVHSQSTLRPREHAYWPDAGKNTKFVYN